MVDPGYALIFVGLALALLVAALIPAPRRPAEEDAGVGLALLSAGCVAALVMGLLAILGLPVATAAVGAVAWLLVMPCIWLARAPQPYDGGWYEESEEDDDGGGSAPPHAPSAPPAPDDRLPGLQPPVAAAARPAAWAPAPQPAPVLATAARAQHLLAAREAERLLAAQQVQRVLAATAQIPLPQVPAAPPGPAPVAPDPRALAPLHTPPWPHVAAPTRVRADHRSVAHILATFAHARTRRQAATAEKRRARARAALRS